MSRARNWTQEAEQLAQPLLEAWPQRLQEHALLAAQPLREFQEQALQVSQDARQQLQERALRVSEPLQRLQQEAVQRILDSIHHHSADSMPGIPRVAGEQANPSMPGRTAGDLCHAEAPSPAIRGRDMAYGEQLQRAEQGRSQGSIDDMLAAGADLEEGQRASPYLCGMCCTVHRAASSQG